MESDGLGVAPISDYDALADLFLADEGGPAMKIGAAAPKAAAMPAPVPAPMPRQMPRLVRTDSEIEETVKPVVVTAAKEPQAGSAPHIEGVIVGHLPVIASAWVTQYARAQADATCEAVALLRVQGDQVWLDVVLPSGAKVSPGMAARPGQSLKAVLQRAAGMWRRWIVRVDQSAEAELLGLNLSSVALLTGTDEPAVIASYQLIKNLGTVTEEDEGPALNLVIMGAGEEKAEEAERSLRRAAGKFLGRNIETTVRVGKIGSSMAVQVFRGPAGMSLGRMLAILEATETIVPVAQVAAPKAV
jgi:hypothetical protein